MRRLLFAMVPLLTIGLSGCSGGKDLSYSEWELIMEHSTASTDGKESFVFRFEWAPESLKVRGDTRTAAMRQSSKIDGEDEDRPMDYVDVRGDCSDRSMLLLGSPRRYDEEGKVVRPRRYRGEPKWEELIVADMDQPNRELFTTLREMMCSHEA